MPKLNIAIDGPAASGKGTVARRIAKRLNLQYIDTGAMYRAVALFGKRRGIDWEDGAGLAEMTASMQFSFDWDGELLHIRVNGEQVTQVIRSENIGVGASRVSKHPLVRSALLSLQQSIAKHGGVVMDGRDIGTVVLPTADVKIYLEADLDVRAKRRHAELVAHGEAPALAEVRAQIAQRDLQDSTRVTAPLAKASDAIIVDSSTRSIEQVVELVMTAIDSKSSPCH